MASQAASARVPRPRGTIEPFIPPPKSAAAAVEIPAHQVGRPLPVADFARYIGYSVDSVEEWDLKLVRPPGVRGSKGRVPWVVFERFCAALRIAWKAR